MFRRGPFYLERHLSQGHFGRTRSLAWLGIGAMTIWSATKIFISAAHHSLNAGQTLLSARTMLDEITMPWVCLSICAICSFWLIRIEIWLLGKTCPISPSIAEQPSHSCEQTAIGQSAVVTPSWRQFHCEVKGLCEERVMCIGSLGRESRMSKLARRLAETGVDVDVINDLDEALGAVSSLPNLWTTMIVDLEHFKRLIGRDEIVEDLSLFRSNGAAIRVVVISGEFMAYQPSLTRCIFADYVFSSSASDESIISVILTDQKQAGCNNHLRQEDSGNVIPFKKIPSDHL